MLVLAFFYQIDVLPETHKQLVAAVARIDGRRVQLVAITQHHPVETAAHEESDRMGGTARHTAIEHTLLMGVHHTASHIRTIGGAIRTHQHRRLYSNKRISQTNIVSARQIISPVYL